MIGDNIKFYRKKNQLTQDDIAEACNVTRQAVSKWENGESLPTVDNLYALSRLLHTSVDDILIGEKERDDEPSLSFSFYIFFGFLVLLNVHFYILNFLACGRNRSVINHYGKTVNG